jgi:hypothetical protein
VAWQMSATVLALPTSSTVIALLLLSFISWLPAPDLVFKNSRVQTSLFNLLHKNF